MRAGCVVAVCTTGHGIAAMAAYWGRGPMRVLRVLTTGSLTDRDRGAAATQHMTHSERLSLLEEIRREAARVFHHDYPRRLRRVLEVAERE